MDVVIDTDILSTFCKIDRLELLQRLFHKSTIIVAPSVSKEIRQAVQSGLLHYSPPSSFSKVKLSPAERKLAKKIRAKRKLGQGDCECIAIARYRNCVLLTNDQPAEKEAESHSVEHMNLPLILRELWKTGIMPREKVIELVKEIETKDRMVIRDPSSILK
jgi:predicted nucleic acid-binding protein